MGFWRGRKVLLTGHTGFKGAWLSCWLGELGAEVTGLALATETKPNMFDLVSPRIRSVIGDVRDAELVARVVRESRPEVVIHMAAQALVRRSYRDPIETYATNVMGTVHVLEAIRKHGAEVRSVVVVTSDKCYENREWIWGYKETDPMGGHDPYSNSKGCSELVTASYRSSFFETGGVRLGSARAGNVIGGGDWSEDRLIPDIMKSCMAGQEVVIRNPHAIRPWQHVLEPLSGYLALAEQLATGDREIACGWNFGPYEADVKTVEQIVSHVAEIWDGVRWRRQDSADSANAVHEAKYLKLDSSQARALLNWKPRLNVNEALSWTVDWYKSYLRDPNSVADKTRQQISQYLEKSGGLA